MELTLDNSIGIVTPESIIRGVKIIPSTGDINLEVLVMIVGFILMCIYTNLIGIALEGDGGIQTYLTILLMIDGADFESFLVTAD